jgi:hypothetical protein
LCGLTSSWWWWWWWWWWWCPLASITCGQFLGRLSDSNEDSKLKLSQCFFNQSSLHDGVLWEWRYSSTHPLASALDGGEWSASRPGRYTLRERAPGTHWIGDWVDPRAVLDAVVKRKIPRPRRESKPRTPIVQSVAQRYTDWAITAVGSVSAFAIRVFLCLLVHRKTYRKH